MAEEIKMSVKVQKSLSDFIKTLAKDDRRSGNSYVAKLLEDHAKKNGYGK